MASVSPLTADAGAAAAGRRTWYTSPALVRNRPAFWMIQRLSFSVVHSSFQVADLGGEGAGAEGCQGRALCCFWGCRRLQHGGDGWSEAWQWL